MTMETRIYVYETLCPQQMLTKHCSYYENGGPIGGGGPVFLWGGQGGCECERRIEVIVKIQGGS